MEILNIYKNSRKEKYVSFVRPNWVNLEIYVLYDIVWKMSAQNWLSHKKYIKNIIIYKITYNKVLKYIIFKIIYNNIIRNI